MIRTKDLIEWDEYYKENNQEAIQDMLFQRRELSWVQSLQNKNVKE